MSKFKVGDKVKVIKDTCFHGQRVGEVVEIEEMGYRVAIERDRPAWGIVGSLCYISERDIGPIENHHSIHITCTDNKTTHAVKKVDGKIVARSKAVCCPTDGFDFNIGAQLAFNRLVYGTDYNPSEVALKPEQPKRGLEKAEPEYYSGKVVCVDNGGGLASWWDVGKVYGIRGGVIRDNDGIPRAGIKSVEWLNNMLGAFAKFIEFKGE